MGVSPCPSDNDFRSAIGTTTSLYNKPSDVRSLLSASNGGPYVILMNSTYPTNNLELLSLMSDPTSTTTDWMVYTKLNSIQIASGSEFNVTYPYISDYIGKPTSLTSVDNSSADYITATRYFERGSIELETQPTTFSQTLPTTQCSSTPVTILGANNPTPFKTYTVTAYLNPSVNIRSYTYVPPLGTIHATYDWTTPTTGEAVSYYLVQHSTDNSVTWTTLASVTDPACTIHAVRTLHNTIRVAAVDALGRQGIWSVVSADYIPTINETDPGDPLE
jgi:hypothetical protein